MNQQEFKEYYKKNKTVVIGVPIIVFVLLLDMAVLKPARQKKLEELKGTTTEQTAPIAMTNSQIPAADGSAKGPVLPPEPIQPPVYPLLSTEIDTRFAANQVYPYSKSRNIFIQAENSGSGMFSDTLTVKEEILERPEISYHGFFTLGKDKVAILRLADELLLTKVGSILKRGPFFLRSVLPEKIVISDVSEEIKEFEVSLSDSVKE